MFGRWIHQLHKNFGLPFLLLVISIYWTQGFRGFPWTGISYLLKDELKLSPTASQLLTSTSLIPWSIKPLYGILSDCVYINGARRVPYILLASLLSFIAWISMALFQASVLSTSILTGLLICHNLGAAMADVVIDAMVAESAQKERSRFAGDLQTLSWFSMAVGGVLGNLTGGIFLKMFKPQIMFAIFSIFPFAQFAASAFLNESRMLSPSNIDRNNHDKNEVSVSYKKEEIEDNSIITSITYDNSNNNKEASSPVTSTADSSASYDTFGDDDRLHSATSADSTPKGSEDLPLLQNQSYFVTEAMDTATEGERSTQTSRLGGNHSSNVPTLNHGTKEDVFSSFEGIEEIHLDPLAAFKLLMEMESDEKKELLSSEMGHSQLFDPALIRSPLSTSSSPPVFSPETTNLHPVENGTLESSIGGLNGGWKLDNPDPSTELGPDGLISSEGRQLDHTDSFTSVSVENMEEGRTRMLLSEEGLRRRKGGDSEALDERGKLTSSSYRDFSEEKNEKMLLNEIKRVWISLFQAVKQPSILRPLIWFMISCATIPSMQTTMFYYQTNHLGLDVSSLGHARVIGWLGLMIGTVLYNTYLKRYPLRKIFLFVHILMALCTLWDIVLVSRFNLKIGFSDTLCVLGASAITDAVNQFKFMPFLILSAQLCPPGIEGTLFALFMSANNFGYTISGYLGAYLASYLGITSVAFSNLSLAILIQSFCTLIPILFLFMIPPDVTGIAKEEGQIHEI